MAGGKVVVGEIAVTLVAPVDGVAVAIATVDEGGASSVLRPQMA